MESVDSRGDKETRSGLAVGELWALADSATRPGECVLAARGVRTGSGVYDRRALRGSDDRVRCLAGSQLPDVNTQETRRSRRCLGLPPSSSDRQRRELRASIGRGERDLCKPRGPGREHVASVLVTLGKSAALLRKVQEMCSAQELASESPQRRGAPAYIARRGRRATAAAVA
ncbi:unnamed protein product, partial [Trichogramma brassicae]